MPFLRASRVSNEVDVVAGTVVVVPLAAEELVGEAGGRCGEAQPVKAKVIIAVRPSTKMTLRIFNPWPRASFVKRRLA